ncbi:hypothetical protein [Streptomyces sp. NBC_00690]|uniref:hypothetical protein n=1 Tax=Streptomyces sp. NBC_00690 TaxID=2975808 RepID=UPI002E2AA9FC|nr:hypothetical protein [Streptomyces sp. NBC_00690]
MNPDVPVQEEGPLICGVRAVLPMRLVALMLHTAPDAGDPMYIETTLSCKLEAHPIGLHYDLVWQLDDTTRGEMWAAWVTEHPPQTVLLLPDCSADNGEPAGLNEACTLFACHPGVHSFGYRDPEAEAIVGSPEHDQLLAEINALFPRRP